MGSALMFLVVADINNRVIAVAAKSTIPIKTNRNLYTNMLG